METNHTRMKPTGSHHRHHPWRRLTRPLQHFLFDDPGFLPTPPASPDRPAR